ncbi:MULTISPECIES: FAD-dependent oxidoreductase [Asticcacaulis]|uniref:FAD-dependent oxidoreductase n=1 Tax=Asticcacaulis TaxID=76890 RepID=UPI001AE728AE|nr:MULTISPECIES: FAD-dependent oxidoreductase [Asticcacaulis]MBP2161312.1 glycine/D-amino acid oxidase-like deaminating enzyme/nitrite reductase/ring-hydroxylating ferredoxin subunit [Asticcacaulis solisilvae]MDR6802322.1 glycine/D-amino acid oxidase-like deaminating enzyme/nitrite reductase/ring-hydroxylating ferredoxin subunit [Asticcacaulis sp. BE141]
MNVDVEASWSLWMDVPAPFCERMPNDVAADVLVIGAGIAGLSSAYELMKQGRDVVVVDRGKFGRGQTARTSAHLAFACDDYYDELIRMLGQDAARQYYQSQSAAVDRIEAIAAAEGIACDFARVDGYFVPAKIEDVKYLKDELDAVHRIGYTDVTWVESGGVPGHPTLPALRFPRQARFHPLKYLNGLVDALKAGGAHLYEDIAVENLKEKDGKVTANLEDGRHIVARQVVVATNTPFHLTIPMHTKQAPYRSYVVALSVEKGAVPDILLWDTLEPGYHYVRIQPGADHDILIVGGEDHKSGEADDGEARLDALEAWARERYPGIRARLVGWSGQVYEPADFAPYIGKSPEYDNVYLVTGDSGEGLTTGAAAGLILRDLLEGRENPWADLYEPRRKPARPTTVGDYIMENLTVATSVAEHILPAGNHEHDGEVEVGSFDDIKPEQGALCRHGLGKVAAYRDAGGRLHVCSATCTHAGCVVHWNSFERCWDCPCHGSQFDINGQVLQGPAVKPLGKVEV